MQHWKECFQMIVVENTILPKKTVFSAVLHVGTRSDDEQIHLLERLSIEQFVPVTYSKQ
jgi:hypothetical protein